MKITNSRMFKGALLAALISVSASACSTPANGNDPTSTASPAAVSTAAPTDDGTPIAMSTTEVKEGEGDQSLDGAGAAKVAFKVWDDKFGGKPFGRGQMEVLVIPDSPQLPGLWQAIQGMKKGGVRNVEISAKELFGTMPAGVNVKPSKTFYIEATVNEIYEEEPFEITTVKEGKGDKAAAAGDIVQMHYVGHLENKDGEVFDSSRERGQPFTVELGSGQVITGWEKGLIGMKEGELRTLSIPHYLAYGDQEKGKIKPKSRLFFEVELVDFVEPGELTSTTVTEGSGDAIESGEMGRFHYTGWLDGFDGKQMFDSSKKPGREPLSVKVGAGQVIKGWDQGLVGMKPGEVRRLEIPYNLAYGPQGRPPTIPQYATLYFEVEYLGPPAGDKESK